MKKVAIVLSFLLATGALVAGEHGSCDKEHHASNAAKSCDMQKGKTAEMTGHLFMKDNARYFQAKNSDRAYAICEHSTAKLDKLGDDVNVRVKAKVINCPEADGKEVLFIEKADKI